MIKENFIKIYEESFRANWRLPAFTNYSSKEMVTYQEFAYEIAKLHILFKDLNVKKGDRIALVGRNNTNWCLSYMAVVTYGAVIVPILQEFNAKDIQHIINHSGSLMLFCSNNIWENIEEDTIERVKGVVSLNDMSLLHDNTSGRFAKTLSSLPGLMQKKYPDGFKQSDIRYADVGNEQLVLINYTSGTTGFSKGVMLTGNNLAGNVTYAWELNLLNRGERALSFLPLAHAYGCAFNFLLPLSVGVHVTLLDKVPSPKILMKAFATVRPNVVITVPLIIEKIYRRMLLPAISKPAMRMALKVPILNDRIYRMISAKLKAAMGGEFREVIIGGAALNKDVEDLLLRMKFPFSVGYGMTECGPLISYDHNYDFVPSSCGQILRGIMEVRIDSSNPYEKVGEIQVKGENVMMGYYKNPEATREVFTDDGWLRTGDLGTIDRDNRIFIRGRSKTMILGASGQNVFPEEIEAKLNNLPYVSESLVIEKNGKLVALVYPDMESADANGVTHQRLPLVMDQNRAALNKLVAPYEAISAINLFPNEFEKTPKKSIKRYLYQSH